MTKSLPTQSWLKLPPVKSPQWFFILLILSHISLSCWFSFGLKCRLFGASQVTLVVKSLPANAGDVREAGSILHSGKPSGGGHGNPLQHSFLEKPMDRGAWWARVHRVAKSRTWLKHVHIWFLFISVSLHSDCCFNLLRSTGILGQWIRHITSLTSPPWPNSLAPFYATFVSEF